MQPGRVGVVNHRGGIKGRSRSKFGHTTRLSGRTREAAAPVRAIFGRVGMQGKVRPCHGLQRKSWSRHSPCIGQDQQPVDNVFNGRLTVSINDTAAALGVGRDTVYVMIQDGRLIASKFGARTVVHTSSIRQLLISLGWCYRRARAPSALGKFRHSKPPPVYKLSTRLARRQRSWKHASVS